MSLRAEIERLRNAAGLRPGPSSVYEMTDDELLEAAGPEYYEAVEALMRELGGENAVEELNEQIRNAPWRVRKDQGQA